MSLPRINLLATARSVTTRRYMQPGEQEVLLTLAATARPRIFVEVGVNVGLTALAILQHCPSIERYWGIDIQEGYQFEIPEQASERSNEPGKLVNDDPRFTLCLRDRDELPSVADMVFIDGDHGYHSVGRDSKWATEIVRPGGLIVWHDYGNPAVEVTEVLDEMYGAGRNIFNVNGTWLAFERR